MADAESFPIAFAADREADKFLAGVKKRAATKFSRKKQASLENAMRLAYWLYVFRKDDEALDVCRFLGTYEFAGNFNLWSWIEYTLALQSRIARQRGQDDESAECLHRIRAAGFVSSRLTGNLLDDKLECIRSAASAKNKTGERDWSLTALLELCVLIELGGSRDLARCCPGAGVSATGPRLRTLLKVS